MRTENQVAHAEHAATLRALHLGERPLVLPNAWDADSARAVERAGFPVVATGSAAVAATLGYEDHEAAPVDEMFAAAARIAAAVSVPVTVDAEAGYGLRPAELVDRLIAAGAHGCNLEDTDHRDGGLIDPGALAEYLAAVRAAARARGADLVINARVDVFVQGSEGDRVGEALRRGRRYFEAGADCVYPILARGEDTVAELVRGIGGPVNILYLPSDYAGALNLARLADLGVARISFGPGLHRAVQAAHARMLERIAAEEDPYSR